MNSNDLGADEVFDLRLAQPRWLVIQTTSNQENKVQSAIETLVKEKGFSGVVKEVLVPSEKVVDIKGGKKYSRTRKFYPGYVFINMCLYNENGEFLEEVFSAIRRVPGVAKFISNGREPAVLPQSEIDEVLDKVAAVAGKTTSKINYEIGEMIKINDGPFLNLTGTIEDIDKDQGRLRVNVSMFGRSTPVDLEFWQVNRYSE